MRENGSGSTSYFFQLVLLSDSILHLDVTPKRTSKPLHRPLGGLGVLFGGICPECTLESLEVF